MATRSLRSCWFNLLHLYGVDRPLEPTRQRIRAVDGWTFIAQAARAEQQRRADRPVLRQTPPDSVEDALLRLAPPHWTLG